MSHQPNRLDVDRSHQFGGTLIDRKRPLRFRLNGRPVDGFAGDSVLSAALASGIDTAGVLNGTPMALSLRFAPPIIRRDKANAPRPALPMARTLAQDGVDYVTPSHAGALLHRLWPFGGKYRRSLGVRLDSLDALAGPWRDMAATSAIACDVLVIGGGVAGMSAALAAARAGQRVTLVEAAGSLGGHCRYFGAQDGEETPDQSIARLGRSVAEFDTVTVLLRTRASAVHSGHARLHHVVETNGVSTNAIIDVTARHIILATGSLERLPVFSGNRLPGVVGSLEAYDLASRYGVWPGRSAIFTTVTNAPYRLATRAADAGITITRIVDARSAPESRFIEFSKAYGLPMALDTVAAQVAPSARGAGLAVVLQSGEDKFAHREAPLASDALIVAGGWQPDLTLWHMAGGHSRWEVSRARFEPQAGPAGLGLAGSAVGHFSKQACIASGEAVVAQLLGLKPVMVLENAIDPIYETADAWTPIAVLQSSDPLPSYLDAGASCVARPPSRPVNLPINWHRSLPFATPPPAWSLADHPRTLGIGDVAAAIQLGTIPPQHGAIVAMERAANDDRLVSSPATAPNVGARANAVPAYLNGRFGSDPHLWRVASIDKRVIEIGALIFSDSDQSDPRLAIGTIVWHADAGAIAVLGKTNASQGDHLTLRASDQTIVIELVSRDDLPAA